MKARIAILILCASLGGSIGVASAQPVHKYKVIPESDVEARWCLNETVPVIQLKDGAAMPNKNKKVELGDIDIYSACTSQSIFDPKDKVKIDRDQNGLYLNIKSASNVDRYLRLNLHADSVDPPRYWLHASGPIDFFVLLQEEMEHNRLIKYFRIEAFADSDTNPACRAERPDFLESDGYKDALKPGPCPNLSEKAKKLKQTGVGGGGEEK